jgi:hypothetical protein
MLTEILHEGKTKLAEIKKASIFQDKIDFNAAIKNIKEFKLAAPNTISQDYNNTFNFVLMLCSMGGIVEEKPKQKSISTAFLNRAKDFEKLSPLEETKNLALSNQTGSDSIISKENNDQNSKIVMNLSTQSEITSKPNSSPSPLNVQPENPIIEIPKKKTLIELQKENQKSQLDIMPPNLTPEQIKSASDYLNSKLSIINANVSDIMNDNQRGRHLLMLTEILHEGKTKLTELKRANIFQDQNDFNVAINNINKFKLVAPKSIPRDYNDTFNLVLMFNSMGGIVEEKPKQKSIFSGLFNRAVYFENFLSPEHLKKLELLDNFQSILMVSKVSNYNTSKEDGEQPPQLKSVSNSNTSSSPLNAQQENSTIELSKKKTLIELQKENQNSQMTIISKPPQLQSSNQVQQEQMNSLKINLSIDDKYTIYSLIGSEISSPEKIENFVSINGKKYFIPNLGCFVLKITRKRSSFLSLQQ